jgi:hypothetical protein
MGSWLGVALLAMCCLSSHARAVQGGDPDTTNRYSSIVLIDLGDTQCSGTAIDDHTVLTAAHCLMDDGNHVATPVFIRDTRGRSGRAEVDRVMIHPQYRSRASATGKADPSSQYYGLPTHDLAILRTSEPITKFLPDVSYSDIPQTRVARVLAEIDYPHLRELYRASEVMAEIARASHSFDWKPLNAFAIGFGKISNGAGQSLDMQRWSIEKRLYRSVAGHPGDDGCVPEADLDEILATEELCYTEARETSVIESNVVPAIPGMTRSKDGLYGSDRGDSGGPLGLPVKYPSAAVNDDGGDLIVVGVLTGGGANVFYSNLFQAENSEFLLNALSESGHGYTLTKLTRSGRSQQAKADISGSWRLESLHGVAVPYDPLNESSIWFDRFFLILPITCTQNFHRYSLDDDVVAVAAEISRQSADCARDPDDNEPIMRELESTIAHAREIRLVGDQLLVRDGNGETVAILRNASAPASAEAPAVKSEKRSVSVYQQRALSFVSSYYNLLSSDAPYALRHLPEFYADRVNFYQKNVATGDIVREKKAFFERWPIRIYDLGPDVKAECDEMAQKCVVTGNLHYDVQTKQQNIRNGKSSGTASFSFELMMADGAERIALESGDVTRRETPPAEPKPSMKMNFSEKECMNGDVDFCLRGCLHSTFDSACDRNCEAQYQTCVKNGGPLPSFNRAAAALGGAH